MTLTTLIIILILAGILLPFIPMDGNVKNILIAVIAVVALVMLLRLLVPGVL